MIYLLWKNTLAYFVTVKNSFMWWHVVFLDNEALSNFWPYLPKTWELQQTYLGKIHILFLSLYPYKRISLSYSLSLSLSLSSGQPVCLTVCLTVCLLAWMLACLPACLPASLSVSWSVFSVCMHVCLSTCLSFCPSIPSVCLPICTSLFYSFCPSVNPSVCWSVCRSVFISVCVSNTSLSLCLTACLSHNLSLANTPFYNIGLFILSFFRMCPLLRPTSK